MRFLDKWGATHSRLNIVLRFAEAFGSSRDLSDKNWFELLGRCWYRFDDVDERLDDLMAGAFYEVADRAYYDYRAGMSKRDISERHGWRTTCINAMMNRTEERDAYNSLPETVRIYRGRYSEEKLGGLVWTLDRNVALKYPTLWEGEGSPLLVTGLARKRDIIAVKIGRDGQEILTWQPAVVAEEDIDA